MRFGIAVIVRAVFFWAVVGIGAAPAALLAGAPGLKPVSLDLRRVPLRAAIESVASQADLDFVFGDRLLEGVTVSYRCQDRPVKEALARLLAHTGAGSRWVGDRRVALYPLPSDQVVDLSGYIASTAGPLAGATVSLADSVRLTVADEDGRFQLPRLPAGPLRLNIFATGHVPMNVDWDPARDQSELALILIERPFVSERLTVRLSTGRVLDESFDGSLALAPDELLQRTTVSRDLFQGLRTLPGVESGQGDAGVSFRGARPSENLVLLDGIKLYQLDHAMGHFSALNPDAVRDVAIFKSGYPAQYGDRLAGVLDIAPKGDLFGRRELRAGLDRDIGHATALVPLGSSGSVLVSGRHSLSDTTVQSVSERVFASTFNEEREPVEEYEDVDARRDFRFDDLLARVSWRPGAADTLTATGFRGRDASDEKVDFIGLSDPVPIFTKDGQWGNDGVSLRWSRNWDLDHRTEVSLSRSRYESEFRFSELVDFDEETLTPESVSREFDSLLEERTVNLVHTVEWGGAHALETGAFISRVESGYREANTYGFAEEERRETDQQGAYLQHEWHGSEGLYTLVGMRFGHNRATDSSYWEPRLAIRVDVGEHGALRGSWGHYHQFAMRTADTVNYFEGLPTWFLAFKDELEPGFSRNVQMGYRYDRDGFVFDAEAYLKHHEGSLTKLFDPLKLEFEITQRAESHRGLDILAERRIGPWTGRLSYGWRRSRVIRDLTFDEPLDFAADRDRPHIANLSLRWEDGSWRALAVWRAASGAPYGVPEIVERQGDDGDFFLDLAESEEPNSLRLPSTRQLDLRLARRFSLGRGEALAGFSLTNVFDRRNVTHRYFVIEEDDEGLFLAPVDIVDFGLRFSADLQFRF